MLILPHANGAGINFHQLRQRVLNPAGNGYRASLSHVKLRKFFCGQLAGGIDRGPGLADDYVLHRELLLMEELGNDLFRFPGSCSVSHGNQCNMILLNQLFQGRFCLTDLILRRRGIDHYRIQHFSCGIHHSQFAAGSERRVPAQYRLPRHRRLHQQLFQILAEYPDRSVLCHLCQLIADFPLHSRRNQPFIAVLQHLRQNRLCMGIFAGNDLLF